MVISAVHETLAVVLVIEPASHPDNRRPAQLIFAVGRPRIVHDGFWVTDHHADEGDEPAVGRPCRAGGAFGQRADLKRIAPSQNVQDEDLVDGAAAARKRDASTVGRPLRGVIAARHGGRVDRFLVEEAPDDDAASVLA